MSALLFHHVSQLIIRSEQDTACLIRCPPEDCGGDTCCPPVVVGKLVEADNEDGHSGHSH